MSIGIFSRLKSDFNSAVKNPPFGVRVDFAESRALMRRENNRSETTLARVGYVFGVDEKTEFAENLFAENA